MKYKSFLFSALLAGTAALSTQAVAGGAIGGDCCADLEERVAELEATTVRKGNRKVSLQISGNVAHALFFNDLGNNGDLSIGQTAANQSKFRLVGKARISSDLYAGYRIEFGIGDTDLGSSTRNTGSLTGPNNLVGGEEGILTLRHNDLFIGSKTFGKLSIGFGSTASDFSAEVDLSGTIYYAGGSLNEYSVGSNNDGFSRKERIRYDSPSLAGFKVSTSWQDNDDWDVALSYGGALGDFTVAGKVAYFEDDSTGVGSTTGSASILHRPTGLSLTAAASDNDLDDSYWYVKGGIQRKLMAAGKTAFSVDYMDHDGEGFEKIGLQLVQDIDAAAMKISASVWDVENDNPALDDTAGYVGVSIAF